MNRKRTLDVSHGFRPKKQVRFAIDNSAEDMAMEIKNYSRISEDMREDEKWNNPEFRRVATRAFTYCVDDAISIAEEYYKEMEKREKMEKNYNNLLLKFDLCLLKIEEYEQAKYENKAEKESAKLKERLQSFKKKFEGLMPPHFNENEDNSLISSESQKFQDVEETQNQMQVPVLVGAAAAAADDNLHEQQQQPQPQEEDNVIVEVTNDDASYFFFSPESSGNEENMEIVINDDEDEEDDDLSIIWDSKSNQPTPTFTKPSSKKDFQSYRRKNSAIDKNNKMLIRHYLDYVKSCKEDDDLKIFPICSENYFLFLADRDIITARKLNIFLTDYEKGKPAQIKLKNDFERWCKNHPNYKFPLNFCDQKMGLKKITPNIITLP